jgi:excisionase family DNA binding protein
MNRGDSIEMTRDDIPRDIAPDIALLTVHEVARMLKCSARTVYRLADGGHMPRPVKLNTLVRWSRSAVESWIAAGCPRTGKGARR